MYRDIMRWLLILAIAVSSLLSNPVPVQAATDTLTVNGALTHISGYPGGYVGGADHTVLNSDDGDTSYRLYTGGSTYYSNEAWPMSTFVSSYSVINSVTLYVKSRVEPTSGFVSISPICYIGSTIYSGTASSLTTTYATYSKTWTENPATGLSWTAAEINATKFGYYSDWTVGKEHRTTYMYVVVDYDVPVIPTVTSGTTTTSYNGTHNVELNGTITDDGGSNSDMVGWVYGTTSNATTPSSGEAPPASYTVNITKIGTYGEESFSGMVSGLAINTKYYYRAFAHNDTGWAYSAESSFTTFNNPSVSTIAASNVGATTTRINASVTDNGRDTTCTVEWVYVAGAGPYANYAAIAADGASVHVNAAGTYTIGSLPFYNLTGLTTLTTYWFCASITNDVSTQYGTPLNFITESGVNEPESLKGIPTSDTVSLQWIKGSGSENTMIRGQLGSYPASNIDGDLIYFDIYSSTLHEGLTPGTTYYYKAWGEAEGVYSTSNVTLMITTLPAVAASDPLPTPTTPTEWYQATNYSGMANIPFYGLVNWWADTFEIPYATMWSVSALLFCMFMGILVFGISRKLLLTDIVVGGMLIITSVMGLTSMWFLMPFGLFAFAAIAVGERL